MLMLVGVIALGMALLGATAALAMTTWNSGGRWIRGLGIFLIVGDLYRLSVAIIVPWVADSALEWLTLGIGLWLLGHWIHIRRHGHARTRFAHRIFALPGLRAIAGYSRTQSTAKISACNSAPTRQRIQPATNATFEHKIAA